MACTWLCAAGGQQQQGTVIVTVPTVTLGGVVGNVPFQTTCSNCNQSVITAVSYETGGLTWLIFAILCFVGSVPTCPDGQISNQIFRVTTCLENLEMLGNLTAVREMSGILLKVREMSRKKSCQQKVAENCLL